jgi:hypothetical protein
MGFGMQANFNRQTIGPQLAGPEALRSQKTFVQETMDLGLHAAFGPGGLNAPILMQGGPQVNLLGGPQLGGFADAFRGLNVNAFGGAGMQRGGVGFGGIAPMGSAQPPMAQFQAMARYGGAQFAQPGQMGAFRGGFGANVQVQQSRELPVPNFFGGEALKNFQMQGGAVSDMFASGNRKISQMVAEMKAQGIPNETIKAMVQQETLQTISSAVSMMTSILRLSHDMAKGIIANIRA